MRLGFYYHIPIAKRNNEFYLPGYLSVFVEALAKEVEELVLFLHQASKESMEADTLLTAPNIRWINLGKKTPAWHRSLFHKHVLKPVAANTQLFDLLLVRCPSPLAPYFHQVPGLEKRVAYMIIGNYESGAKYMSIGNLRDWAIKYYLLWNHQALEKSVVNQLLFVNSAELFNKYKSITFKIHLVKTTTLAENDFYTRTDIQLNDPIKLAYIGRFDLHKGLMELVEATAILIKEGIPIELHLTGWEDADRKPVEAAIRQKAATLGISSQLHWHGRKKTGEELNRMYREADMYIIPSYHEGFPRTIWEAMANSCPVIATRVGSIPHYLEHEYHALIIPSRSVKAIVDAVERILSDEKLRMKLITNGYELAKTNTLEIQTKKLVQIIEKHIS